MLVYKIQGHIPVFSSKDTSIFAGVGFEENLLREMTAERCNCWPVHRQNDDLERFNAKRQAI